ncbi:MAG: 6-carboxyhexanoate--CoA ligase [Nitrospirae bacterium]|nr:6-carboxyhexanoate--CoA ligase [Nitrospirota bacterium]
MKKFFSIRMRASKGGMHISGAEGIYSRDNLIDMVKKYTQRALSHEKGESDEIYLAVEELKESPRRISALPLCTLNTRNPETVKKAAKKILTSIGIAERAVEEAFKSLGIGIAMRGAMLMDMEGVRLEPDLLRGVRVTRMGITENANSDLSKKLSTLGINNNTVREALILASKVNRHPMVIAELCISDDPNYTTGYIASRTYGYIRLPHIKRRGVPYGGRAFFITGGELKELIEFLQKTPVIINKINTCRGIASVEEILKK